MSEQRFDFKCVLRSRLNKIIDLHGQALAEAIGKREPTSRETQLSDKDLILRFAGSDPTDGKSRTQWLVKTYIKDEQFKLEDLGRVDAALAAFERFKRKLPVEQRELSRFKSLRELEELVDPFVKAEARARLERDLSSATGREKRRLEELKARDESIVVQEGEGILTIAVPMTEFASKWWGRGTRWCTAAENNNAFAQYHEFAPLVIIVCPDGSKFQINIQSYALLFMDNTDENVSEETIRERWNEFESLFYWAVQQNRMALEYLSEDKRSPELCRIAVEQDGLALEFVPSDLKSSRGEEERTSELCWIAIAQNGRALKFTSEDEKTQELCRIAVEQDGNALEYVPKQYITPELYQLAVEQDGMTLDIVPEEERTPELCQLAMEQNGWALQFVPEKHKTYELCLMAIQQDGEALEYVPHDLMVPELYYMAIRQNGKALEYIPENNRTPELCRIAVERNGMALRYVPENQKTSELCCLAIKNGEALYIVPRKHRTPELMALIPPMQPKWNPDILQGLGNQSKPSHEDITQNQDNRESLGSIPVSL
jgi:uncharacterized membrane protein YecN with MAPEG domain